jgi:hypothetical protein
MAQYQPKSFQPAHDWQHKPALDHYAPGKHHLAACACGIESIGVSEQRHGRLDRIETVPATANRLRCTTTGRDHR